MSVSRLAIELLKTGITKNISFVYKTLKMDCSEWKGVPISQVIGSQTPWGAPEFPLVQPAFNHSVLYHIPSSGSQLDKPPKPQIGKDKWDSEHVRLPFSKHSLYPVKDSNGDVNLHQRWDMIKDALNKPIRNSQELANAILSYNTKFKNKWLFTALHHLFEEHLEPEETQYFFDVTLPEMTKLALSLPQLIQSPIPLLKQYKNHSISLSQQQISSLLANAFFCTYPRRNTTKAESEYSAYPHINFNVLFECSPSDHIIEKLKCICHYFKRVCTKAPAGALTVSRRSVRPRALPAWGSAPERVCGLRAHVDPRGTIEDAHGLIQVDFANKFLGGGVLGYGCVQEEIRFMICPELLISMLFTEVLRPNEALMIIGCERYSSYSGYGQSFQWSGGFEDSTPYDSSGRRRCAVLAIDAKPFYNRAQEYKEESIVRELNKAWVGFSFYTGGDQGPHYPGVATGNWGCGAFGGSAELKSLIQMIALTKAGRPMAYYTFDDIQLRDHIIGVYELLAKHSVTIGQLYELIMKFCKGDVKKSNINTFLEQQLEPKTGPSELQSTELAIETQKELPFVLERTLNSSPDLFTPEDDSLTEVIQTNTSENKEETENFFTENEVSTSAQKTSIIETQSQTSRLFDEMEKIDNDSGKLNLKSPQKSFFRPKPEDAMDVEEKMEIDIPSNDKKKLAKKITDYFSRKPI